MPKLLTGRRRRARELRDTCLLLVARHGLAGRQDDDTPVTEAVLDAFRIRLTPSGARSIAISTGSARQVSPLRASSIRTVAPRIAM